MYFDEDEDEEVQELFLGSYEGTRNDREERHGRGKAILPNGDVYEGEYENGKRHGYGVYTFVSGAKYLGHYVHGRKDGSGKLHNEDGSFYDGNWTNGMKCGKGVNCYSNGDRYQGDWFHNKRHGHGKYEFKKTGSVYDGRWVDGHWHGIGELIHQNHRYVGTFDQGLPTGKGKYIFNSGIAQHGYFEILKKPRIDVIKNLNIENKTDEGNWERQAVWHVTSITSVAR
ncbi:radial spoke head 1 homolog isoform X2 [Clytia hemisphaerica]